MRHPKTPNTATLITAAAAAAATIALTCGTVRGAPQNQDSLRLKPAAEANTAAQTKETGGVALKSSPKNPAQPQAPTTPKETGDIALKTGPKGEGGGKPQEKTAATLKETGGVSLKDTPETESNPQQPTPAATSPKETGGVALQETAKPTPETAQPATTKPKETGGVALKNAPTENPQPTYAHGATSPKETGGVELRRQENPKKEGPAPKKMGDVKLPDAPKAKEITETTGQVPMGSGRVKISNPPITQNRTIVLVLRAEAAQAAIDRLREQGEEIHVITDDPNNPVKLGPKEDL